MNDLRYNESMKAVRIHKHGGAEVCQVDEVPEPRPGPEEVVIRVRSAAMGHMDVDVREGLSRLDIALPYIMGFEAAGTIESLGSDVEGWAVGDAVLPYIRTTCRRCRHCTTGRESLCPRRAFVGSAFAELMACPASHLMRLPDGLDPADGAALGTAFGTGWHMLFTRGQLAVGETVLINSVGSGIGSAAVQLAALAGARVIGTASSDEKLARAAELGMAHGINYREQDFAAELARITDGEGVDLVFEHVGGESFQRGLDALTPGGRMVTCGAHAGEVVPLDVIPLFRSETSILGSFGSSRREIEGCLALAAAGRVKPVIHARYPLDAIGDAMREMEGRGNFGKILLQPDRSGT